MPLMSGIGFGGGGGVGNANFTNAATGTYSSGGKNYKFISFLGSGTLTIDKSGLADILVIGGGGAGATGTNISYRAGGGGGAGGAIYGQHLLVVGSYSIIVGAGGAAGPRETETVSGGEGGYSSFGSLILNPGGAGGLPWNATNPTTGICGGGGASDSGSRSGGPGMPPFGYGGGSTSNSLDASGGGGATGAGISANSGGAGGAGYQTSITGSSVTYSTGGNGGTNTAQNNFFGSGSANTGNGGRGNRVNNAGNGGSGIVIVRVQI